MTAEEIIRPLIYKTYGEGVMAEGLAKTIADDVRERSHDNDYANRGREYWIMMRCWDWFTGGTTAASVAEDIEKALIANGL